MPRGPRVDYAGAVHHIYNRGAARRTVLETAADMHAFQDALGRVVGNGLLEVHAFSLLTTHYHLLVASPLGRIGEAMQRVGNEYVRGFNRQRLRDGSLMRGRYGSRLVTSASYFETLVRYIDGNPVAARIAAAAHLYPHGSAWHYARDERPAWLTTGRIEAIVCDRVGAERLPAEMYPVFAAGSDVAARALVGRRLARGVPDEDPLDDLVRAAPIEVQRWMEHKAGLADGTSPGIVLLAAESILGILEEQQVPDPPRRDLAAGLLRSLAGETVAAISIRLGCRLTTASRATHEHARALRSDPAYAALAADVVHRVIRRDFGPPGRLFDLPRRVPDAGIRVEDTSRGFVAR